MEWIIIIILLIVIGIIWYFSFYGNHTILMSDESLIIAFVGILATFIVVGNAQQVREIRKEMHDELVEKKAEENTKRSELLQTIRQELQTAVELPNQQIGIINERLGNFDTFAQKQNDYNATFTEKQQDIQQNIEQIADLVKTTNNQSNEQIKRLREETDSLNAVVPSIQEENNIRKSHLVRIIENLLSLHSDEISRLILILVFHDKFIYELELNDGTSHQAVKGSGLELHFFDLSTKEEVTNIAKVENLRYDAQVVGDMYTLLSSMLSPGNEEISSSPIETENGEEAL